MSRGKFFLRKCYPHYLTGEWFHTCIELAIFKLPCSLQNSEYISIDTAGGVSKIILLADIPSFVNCNIMSVMFVIYCSTVRPRWSKSASTESLEPSNKTTAATLPLGLWSHWRILGRISLLKAEVYPLNPRLRTSHFLVGKIFSSSVRKKNLLSNTVISHVIIALTE